MQDVILTVGGWILAIAVAVGGWVFKMIFGKLKQHEEVHVIIDKKIDDHRLYAAQTFTTKSDIKDMKDEIVRFLGKIEEKLDKKADK